MAFTNLEYIEKHLVRKLSYNGASASFWTRGKLIAKICTIDFIVRKVMNKADVRTGVSIWWWVRFWTGVRRAVWQLSGNGKRQKISVIIFWLKIHVLKSPFDNYIFPNSAKSNSWNRNCKTINCVTPCIKRILKKEAW